MEIELKLALHSRHGTRVRRHPLLRNIRPQQRMLLSIYFDTPDFDLLHRRIALRMRRIDEYWVQTLKAETRSIGALTSRPEWEAAVASGRQPDFTAFPAEALDVLAGIKLDQILPVFTTEFQRTSWLIGHGGTRAEVALDQGTIQAGDSRRDLNEVEIELQSGAPDFLFEIASQLLQRIPLHIEPRSKAERGYILSGAVIPAPSKFCQPAIGKNQAAGETWHATMQAALVQLTANVPGFLEQAHHTEYLHQLRVALRRLRTGAALAKSLQQPLPAWNAPLRELMSALNPARDWDVFQQQTLPSLLTAVDALNTGSGFDPAALDRLHRAAALSRQQAQALLLQPAFTQWMLDIGRSLLSIPVDHQQRDVKTWARTILDRRWQALHKYCHDFARLDSAARHRARIAAKKLRYTADIFSPVYGKEAHDFMNTLAALQNELGYTNDLVKGQQLLREFPKRSPSIGFALGQLCGALAYQTHQHTGLSSNPWKNLEQSKLFWRR